MRPSAAWVIDQSLVGSHVRPQAAYSVRLSSTDAIFHFAARGHVTRRGTPGRIVDVQPALPNPDDLLRVFQGRDFTL